MQRAMRLPNLGPGLTVTVPLDCLPEYLELHGLEPDRCPPPRRAGDLPEPVLIVKRNRPAKKSQPRGKEK